jgi:predicted RNA-binding protein with PUA-like domain
MTDEEKPAYMQLAQQALESPAGQATVTLLIAQHAAVKGLIEINRLPSTDDEEEGSADYLAALDAVVDSGAWRTVGVTALRDSDDPNGLMREAVGPYMSRLRLLANHVLLQKQRLGIDASIDPATLALAASSPGMGYPSEGE